MILKMTIKKETPDFKEGEIFYLRGSKVSNDRKYWFEDKKVIALRDRKEWAEVKKTKYKDTRPHLSEIVKMELFTAEEAFDKLGWDYKEKKKDDGYYPICCGKKVYMSGFLGIERAICETCEKNMQDMSGGVMTSSVCMGFITEDYQADDNKRWAVNILNHKDRSNDE